MPQSKQKSNALFASLIINVLLAAAVLALAIGLLYNGQHQQASPITLTVTQGNQIAANAVKANQSNGTLAGFDQPLNASELAAINDEPLSNFQTAGERLLNGTLTNEIFPVNSPQYNAILINGKPTVVYIGADTCPFCGENRWAMALALSQFGNFTQLFQGYSALQDGDVPTLYWVPMNATVAQGVEFGNYYQSNYINFITAEYESPITGHFSVQPLSYFISQSPNQVYNAVLNFMNATGKFQGTPFTMWGTSLDAGADAVVVGNNLTNGWNSLSNMTHAEILSQLQSYNDQFAWGEYAAADVYIAQLCPSIKGTAPPVCGLSSIKQLESLMNLSQ